MDADDLAQLVTDLHRDYPRYPRPTIERLALRLAAQFHDAQVQEFVLTLVRRQASDQLRYAESIAVPDPAPSRRSPRWHTATSH